LKKGVRNEKGDEIVEPDGSVNELGHSGFDDGSGLGILYRDKNLESIGRSVGLSLE